MAPPTSTDWKSDRSFFSRAWFHRLWTVQEPVIRSSKSKVLLICGDEQITWDKMLDFAALAVDRGWSPTLSSRERFLSPEVKRGSVFGVDLSSTVGPIYRAEYQPDVSDSITAWLQYAFGCHNEVSFLWAKFAWLLTIGRQKQVTDQRDRNFAPVGLVSMFEKLDVWKLLDADYSKSFTDKFCHAS
jgi:hypothetical protein